MNHQYQNIPITYAKSKYRKRLYNFTCKAFSVFLLDKLRDKKRKRTKVLFSNALDNKVNTMAILVWFTFYKALVPCHKFKIFDTTELENNVFRILHNRQQLHTKIYLTWEMY
ncbi:hypothetical protein CHS0354_004390 [Potamilus streckersoni]|uniref:Uncharacterized protein n=1 Tax=Potamilus streckersoni TaxID=2493646 RepID=A0AAE0SZS3_9BIVA|nr:hypothetical protein CHS0354_004390 [Potamilus streckersoni]